MDIHNILQKWSDIYFGMNHHTKIGVTYIYKLLTRGYPHLIETIHVYEF